MTAEEYKRLIDKIYFGIGYADAKVDYLQDDINKAFRAIIKYYTIAEILRDTSEAKILNKKELRFTDWVHSSALIEIRKSIEIELLIRLRLLLAKERYSGRKLKDIKDLAECDDGSQTGGSFIEDLKKYCDKDKRRKTIKSLITEFEEKGYYNRLIVENQKILLHKDSAPEKRSEKDVIADECKKIIYYASNADFDRDTIIGLMEDLSKIIIEFLGNNTNLYRIAGMENLYDYNKKLASALYDEKKSGIIANNLTESMKICFKNTIAVIHWR